MIDTAESPNKFLSHGCEKWAFERAYRHSPSPRLRDRYA